MSFSQYKQLFCASALMVSFSLYSASLEKIEIEEKEKQSAKEIIKEFEKDFEDETGMTDLNKSLKSATNREDAIKLCKEFMRQKSASMSEYIRHELAYDALSRWAQEKGLSKPDRPNRLDLEDRETTRKQDAIKPRKKVILQESATPPMNERVHQRMACNALLQRGLSELEELSPFDLGDSEDEKE